MLKWLKFQKENLCKGCVKLHTIHDNTLTRAESSITTFIVPFSVRGIADSVFKNNYKLKTIVINLKCEFIDSSAFEGCNAIERINLPDNIYRLGQRVFKNCTSLKDIKLSPNILDIPHSAFSGCKNLQSIKLPPALNSIGSYAFNNCKNLEYIYIPDTVQAIGEGAFSDCDNLKEIHLPHSLLKLCKYTFNDCSKLNKINLPPNLQKIEDYVFYGCTNLSDITSKSNKYKIINNCIIDTDINQLIYYIRKQEYHNFVIPNKIHSIAPAAFFADNFLTQVEFNKNISVIPEECFYQCHHLKDLNISESITSIEAKAFKNCNINHLYIPNSIVCIGLDSFDETTKYN